jgi:hypothetical protein
LVKERRPQRSLLKPTLGDLMKLVVFTAVVLACLAPALRVAAEERVPVGLLIVFEGMAMPLALALATLVMLRPGPVKDWLVRAPVVIVLAIWLGMLIVVLTEVAASAGGPVRRFPTADLILFASMAVVLSLALFALGRRLVPGWCPTCRLPTLLHTRLPGSLPNRRDVGLHQCVSCGGRFRKSERVWEALPAAETGAACRPPLAIQITRVPPGEAPEPIRQAWVGLTLPVSNRYPGRRAFLVFGVLSGPRTFLGTMLALILGRAERRVGYAVDGRVAVDALASRSPEAAEWWQSNAPSRLEPGRVLLFEADVCEEVA